MKIRKINFNSTPWEGPSKLFLCMIKFFGARTWRVCQIPERIDTLELRQVLNTVCKAHKKGIWYFEDAAVTEISTTLLHMNIDVVIIGPSKSGLS